MVFKYFKYLVVFKPYNSLVKKVFLWCLLQRRKQTQQMFVEWVDHVCGGGTWDQILKLLHLAGILKVIWSLPRTDWQFVSPWLNPSLMGSLMRGGHCLWGQTPYPTPFTFMILDCTIIETLEDTWKYEVDIANIPYPIPRQPLLLFYLYCH